MADQDPHPRSHGTHACCDGCGLRFSAAYAAHVHQCPMCRGPLAPATPERTLGHQLYVDMTIHPIDDAPGDAR